MADNTLSDSERESLRALCESEGVTAVAAAVQINRITLLQLLSGLQSRTGTILQARTFLQGRTRSDVGRNASTITRGE